MMKASPTLRLIDGGRAGKRLSDAEVRGRHREIERADRAGYADYADRLRRKLTREIAMHGLEPPKRRPASRQPFDGGDAA
jgi:hypothetical protein